MRETIQPEETVVPYLLERLSSENNPDDITVISPGLLTGSKQNFNRHLVLQTGSVEFE